MSKLIVFTIKFVWVKYLKNKKNTYTYINIPFKSVSNKKIKCI